MQVDACGRARPARATAAGPSSPSSVVPGAALRGGGCGRRRRRRGLRRGRRRLGACGLGLRPARRASGRTVSTTWRQSARSSALSGRSAAAEPRDRAARQQQIRPGRATHRRRRSSPPPRPAPQKVSKRLAPRIAPPVSCATHRPLARALSIPASSTGAPSGTNRGSAATLTARRHRPAERAERPGAGQLLEEDVALVLAHQRPPRLGIGAHPVA